MTVPSVDLTILENGLGILPTLAGGIPVIVGVTTQGPIATPASFAKAKDIQTTFGKAGLAVEAASYLIEYTGRPVVFVRADTATDGSYGTVTDSTAGTTAVTVDSAVKPNGEYDFYFLVTTGGTIGTSGVKYQYSLDGGRTMSAVTSLGTATSITFTEANIKIDFSAGTILLGDSVTFRTEAPKWDSTTLGAAFTAIKLSTLPFEYIHVLGKCNATEATQLDTFLQVLETEKKKYRWGMCNTRRPDDAETESTYFTSLDTAFTSFTSSRVMVCAGYVKTLSSVTRRQPKLPVSITVSARATEVPIQTSLAQVDLGPLDAVVLTDSSGNPDDHDEAQYPGLDDSRFTVLRTIEGFSGVYVNLPRIFAAPTSDFQRLHLRRVMNAGATALRAYLMTRLNKYVRTSPATGYIDERDARDIELGAFTAMANAVLTSGAASSVKFVLSRTDNVLSTSILNGTALIQPLGYPEKIKVEMSFVNPAIVGG